MLLVSDFNNNIKQSNKIYILAKNLKSAKKPMESQLHITFNDVSLAEANRLAIDLQVFLKNTNDTNSDIKKERDDTQDIGSIVTILCSSALLPSLIKGLSTFLLKKQNKHITIKKDGTIIGKNLNSKDLKNILETINK